MIQSPVVSTAVTTTLAARLTTTDDSLRLTGITSISGSDLIKIGDEIIRVDGVGIGQTNRLTIRRGWLGTG